MSSANENLRVAHALVGALVAGGARRAFISPGSRNTPFVLALDQLLGPRAHVVLDERSAAFAALGAARASSEPVLLACTSGSAAAHYLPALIEARHSELPLIVLTADRPPEEHHCGAGQTIEQLHLFGAFVRWFADLGVASVAQTNAVLASTAAQALFAATASPSGPVHLNLAFREPLWTPGVTPPPGEPLSLRRIDAGPGEPSTELLAPLVEELARARRGVIICGPRTAPSQAQEAGTAAAVATLARKLGWPILADAASGLRFGPESQDVAIGAYDPMLRDAAFARNATPEFVLRFGQQPASKPLAQWLSRATGGTALVTTSGELHDPFRLARTVVRAAPAAVCNGLASAWEAREPARAWLAGWRDAEQAAQSALGTCCADAFFEGSVARQLVQHAPSGSMLHVASSMPVRDIESFAAPRPEPLFLTSNRGANGIDGTIATAVGQAAAFAGPVIGFLGDLAFLHDVGSLLTARSLGVGLTLVVLNNRGGGIFDFLDIAKHPTAFEKYFSTPQDADLGALARAAGAEHVRVVEATEFAAAAQPSPSGRVRVVEVITDRQHNVARHSEAWAAVSTALTRLPKSPRHKE